MTIVLVESGLLAGRTRKQTRFTEEQIVAASASRAVLSVLQGDATRLLTSVGAGDGERGIGL